MATPRTNLRSLSVTEVTLEVGCSDHDGRHAESKYTRVKKILQYF